VSRNSVRNASMLFLSAIGISIDSSLGEFWSDDVPQRRSSEGEFIVPRSERREFWASRSDTVH
jgi:hypothetical protein